MTAHFDLCSNAAEIGACGAEIHLFVLITSGDSGHSQGRLEGAGDDQC